MVITSINQVKEILPDLSFNLMRLLRIINILLLIFMAEPGLPQSMEWLVQYREKVFANYNILGGEDAYKQYQNNFYSRVSVSRIDDTHFNISFQDTDSAQPGNRPGWSLSVKLNHDKQLDSIFLPEQINREQEIQSKLILSFIQYFNFKSLPINKETKEEYLDGLYPVWYTFKKRSVPGPDGNK